MLFFERVDDVDETIHLVDPFRIVSLSGSSPGLRTPPRQSVYTVFDSWNVNQLEVKQKNPCYPSIDYCTRVHVWVVDHSFDGRGVYFRHKVLDSDDPDSSLF